MPVSWQIGPESSTAISMLARMMLSACEDCVCGVSASDAMDMAARTSGGKLVDVCVISSSRLVARNSIWVTSIFALCIRSFLTQYSSTNAPAKTQRGPAFERNSMRSLRMILSALLVLGTAFAQEITTPEKYFGFQLGADKKMARWDKIVAYYAVLEKESAGRMKVINMGPTSENNPFLMVIITSPANFAKLEHLREINLRISDPRGLTEAQARALTEEGKAVVVQSMSMHATEIGGTQMAPELAYRFTLPQRRRDPPHPR